MNRSFTALLLFLILGACATGRRAGDEEILKQAAGFAGAFASADVVRLSPWIAPGYTHTNAGSPPIGRDQWLGFVARRHAELRAGQLQLTRYENLDLRVTHFEGGAIVTGLNVSEGLRGGKPFTTRLRFTQVWIRTRAGWQRIAFHDSPAT